MVEGKRHTQRRDDSVHTSSKENANRSSLFQRGKEDRGWRERWKDRKTKEPAGYCGRSTIYGVRRRKRIETTGWKSWRSIVAPTNRPFSGCCRSLTVGYERRTVWRRSETSVQTARERYPEGKNAPTLSAFRTGSSNRVRDTYLTQLRFRWTFPNARCTLCTHVDTRSPPQDTHCRFIKSKSTLY